MAISNATSKLNINMTILAVQISKLGISNDMSLLQTKEETPTSMAMGSKGNESGELEGSTKMKEIYLELMKMLATN